MGCCSGRVDAAIKKDAKSKESNHEESESKPEEHDNKGDAHNPHSEEKKGKSDSHKEEKKEHKGEESKKGPEKKPDQAGGHAGSLIARGDKLLKRVGPAEFKFYTSLFDEENKDEDLIELRKFVPKYFEVEQIEGKDYLVLENLLTDYDHPNILDCKIGKVTWTPDHNERKTADQKKKAETTTTGSLGFRISGLVVKDEHGAVVESFAKEEGFYGISPENIHEFFKKIVGEDKKQVKKFIRQTGKIIDWFKKQRSKIFFTASVFYVFGKNGKSQTRFIDFAHVYDAHGKEDENVIQGLESVVEIWKRLL
ncbi:hypothetical protein SteCoe_15110 [Stentor coeruleus]|uniref:Kinase n=1 Tax=Stentor coeruleus TaxID=5963 RepID=A0A1R2C4D2_9CILI|nr:hypothetical protein SteCoe_15110 [Stentor coeruleus]